MQTANGAAPNTTLLIVEDEILMAMALKEALEEAGYLVMDIAVSHHEALTAAQTCTPDLALVNIRLQDKDDGIALARNLADLKIPVLFISGQASCARSAQTLAIASFPKPYRAEQMVAAVHYLLACLQGDASLPRPGGLELFDGLAAAAEGADA